MISRTWYCPQSPRCSSTNGVPTHSQIGLARASAQVGWHQLPGLSGFPGDAAQSVDRSKGMQAVLPSRPSVLPSCRLELPSRSTASAEVSRAVPSRPTSARPPCDPEQAPTPPAATNPISSTRTTTRSAYRRIEATRVGIPTAHADWRSSRGPSKASAFDIQSCRLAPGLLCLTCGGQTWRSTTDLRLSEKRHFTPSRHGVCARHVAAWRLDEGAGCLALAARVRDGGAGVRAALGSYVQRRDVNQTSEGEELQPFRLFGNESTFVHQATGSTSSCSSSRACSTSRTSSKRALLPARGLRVCYAGPSSSSRTPTVTLPPSIGLMNRHLARR